MSAVFKLWKQIIFSFQHLWIAGTLHAALVGTIYSILPSSSSHPCVIHILYMDGSIENHPSNCKKNIELNELHGALKWAHLLLWESWIWFKLTVTTHWHTNNRLDSPLHSNCSVMFWFHRLVKMDLWIAVQCSQTSKSDPAVTMEEAWGGPILDVVWGEICLSLARFLTFSIRLNIGASSGSWDGWLSMAVRTAVESMKYGKFILASSMSKYKH